ncbi:MAG TPA: periplasmic heavy metal sensor [Thermoanaerobaculia bacterium]|nr:periplasmic heavy metal sensor [Thermoanaerobaculia bacterium]
MSRLSASVLALALLAPAAARAQLPEGAIGKWWKRPRVVEALHLTPEQQERLEAIFGKNRRSFIDLKADVERRQVDLEELMARKDSEPKKVSSAVDALEQAKLRLRKAHAMMVLDMREILTADQWRALLDRVEDARQMREERRLNRRGMLHGPRDGPRGTPGPSESREKPDGE